MYVSFIGLRLTKTSLTLISNNTCIFWLVPEHAPGPSSQVLPGCRVRHPCYSAKLFVWLVQSSVWLYEYIRTHVQKYIPYGQKLDLSGVCFGWYVLALSVRKRIFLKTKKADPKHCENWWRESGSEFHKASPMCERGEWRKQLRDLITQSLKQSSLGSGSISSIFWPNGICACINVSMLICRCTYHPSIQQHT